ncbi:MAG: UbiA family prenyltransferase [Planctomycetes bacterium]|nr:UbiA family prenyltransferase [Planctomycetota bacterium]
MTSITRTIRNYAELSRLSNIPTVLSNVLVGCAIGASGQAIPGATIAALSAAMMLMYIAGMGLNDYFDTEIDRVERPGRPIPSGRISRRGALIFTIICFALSTAIMSFQALPSLLFSFALMACIVMYDLIHKKFASSVVLMGLCRGLVYLAAASAITWPVSLNIALTLAFVITVYIVLLTMIARGEAGLDITPRRWLSFLLPVIMIAPAFIFHPADITWPVLFGSIATTQILFAQRHVLSPKPRIQKTVMGLLAAICLMDGFFLTLLDQHGLALIALACFFITAWGHRYILGT